MYKQEVLIINIDGTLTDIGQTVLLDKSETCIFFSLYCINPHQHE